MIYARVYENQERADACLEGSEFLVQWAVYTLQGFGVDSTEASPAIFCGDPSRISALKALLIAKILHKQ